MFIPDNTFRTKIFQELEGGDKSISNLHRALTDNGHKVHRLVLTGYLKAMEDMGVLSSREFPPSKVYSVSTILEKDIYETAGEIIAASFAEDQRPRMTLYFLQKLFRRPIFESELSKAGYEGDPEIFAARIPNDERLELKKTLAKRGLTLQMKEQAFILREANLDSDYESIIQQAFLHKFKAGNLVVDTKQTKLV